MTAKSVINGHEINVSEYTPDLAGSGQFSKCATCKLDATKEGHDGCLGELPTDIVMNACCGHGREDIAYIQYWDGTCIRGNLAIIEQQKLKEQQSESKIHHNPLLGN